MLVSFMPSTFAGQALLLASICIATLVLAGVSHRRLHVKNRRLLNAIDNMSQGLNMFDAQGHIVLLNRRYLEMYKLSPEIVKPGCSLRELIQHRKETGLFSGDVESYSRKILDEMTSGDGKSHAHYVQASDGRIVLAKNEPLADGGWVSTHEDVTEQRHAEQERAAIRDQEKRRATIDRFRNNLLPPRGRKTADQRQRQRDGDAFDSARIVRFLGAHVATR